MPGKNDRNDIEAGKSNPAERENREQIPLLQSSNSGSSCGQFFQCHQKNILLALGITAALTLFALIMVGLSECTEGTHKTALNWFCNATREIHYGPGPEGLTSNSTEALIP